MANMDISSDPQGINERRVNEMTAEEYNNLKRGCDVISTERPGKWFVYNRIIDTKYKLDGVEIARTTRPSDQVFINKSEMLRFWKLA